MAIIYKDGNKSCVGRVLGITTESFNDGYDITYIAIVWNWKTMSPERVSYCNTMSLRCECEIDATALVLSFYNRYKAINSYEYELERQSNETMCPKVGYKCLIARGRTAKGSIVTVKKVYNDDWGRALVTDGTRNYEVYVKNLDVIGIPIDFNTYIPFVRPKALELSLLEKCVLEAL